MPSAADRFGILTLPPHAATGEGAGEAIPYHAPQPLEGCVRRRYSHEPGVPIPGVRGHFLPRSPECIALLERRAPDCRVDCEPPATKRPPLLWSDCTLSLRAAPSRQDGNQRLNVAATPDGPAQFRRPRGNQSVGVPQHAFAPSIDVAMLDTWNRFTESDTTVQNCIRDAWVASTST